MYRRYFAILALGFSSGLPLALIGTTLQAWLAVSHVSVVQIGFVSLIGQPYVIKFLWAPLLDRFNLGFLSRRRDWICAMQLGLVVCLLTMAQLGPQHLPWLLGVAFITACLSATQDIAFDAYRVDVLPAAERAPGAALSVFGYRIAMLCAGGIALLLADRIGWQQTYQCMAFLQALALLVTVIAPRVQTPAQTITSMRQAIVEPVQQFFSHEHAWLMLVFIVLYKLVEAFTSNTGVMTNVFLLQGMHFSLSIVGSINKVFGFVATMVGVGVGGWLIPRLGVYRSLWWFGWLQVFSNLGYLLLLWSGKQIAILIFAVSFDNFAAGLGTAAIITFMMSLCDPRFSATQFALLSAISAIGRVYLGPLAGSIVASYGWAMFFVWTFLMGLPAMVLLFALRKQAYFQTQSTVTGAHFDYS